MLTLNEFLAKAGTLLGLAEKSVPDITVLQANLAESQTGLIAAKARAAQFEGQCAEQAATITRLTAELAAEKTKSTAFEAKVSTAAATQALEITAAQGQPPVTSAPVSRPTDAGQKKEEKKGYDRFAGACKIEQLK